MDLLDLYYTKCCTRNSRKNVHLKDPLLHYSFYEDDSRLDRYILMNTYLDP